MFGNATSMNNAVICNLSPNASVAMGEYVVLNETLAGIVLAQSPGTTNMVVTQTSNTTIMSWTRLSNNGAANFSQISLSGRTYVMWATGWGNVYTDTPLPLMDWVAVDFSMLPSTSPTPSATPSVSVSMTASVSATPSPLSNSTSLSKKNGLSLFWGFDGMTYTFRAVLTKLAW